MPCVCRGIFLTVMFLVASIGLAGFPLAAAEIESVKFAETYRADENSLELRNVALLRYRFVIKALVAALYMPAEVRSEEVLADIPKRLEIHYFWSIKGKDIVAASEKLLADNLSAEQMRSLRKDFDYVNSLYPDLKAGDRFQLTYLPGVGTELALNGKRQGLVPGKEFAAAYFTIWLGENPMDVAFRDELLKKR